MNINKIFIIYKRELKDILRDRRTLIAMILIPILLYPVLIIFMGQLMEMGNQKLSREKSAIAYLQEIPHQLNTLLRLEEDIEIKQSADPAEDLQQGIIQVYIEIKKLSTTDSLLVYYDRAVERSHLALRRVNKVIKNHKRNMQEKSLTKAGIETTILTPFVQRNINVAPASRMAGKIMGSVVPMLLIIALMTGAMYPAIDLTAGEKERGTLETILTTPVQRIDLLMGKFLTVSTVTFITGCLNLLSLTLVFSMSLIRPGSSSDNLDFSFSPFILILLLSLILLLALFISSLMLSVCLFARSFKDAQNLITPLFIILMLPSFIGIMPGIELNEYLAFIPILNVILLFKEIMLQNFITQHIFIVFLSNIIFSMTTILVFAKFFNMEQLIFGEGKGLLFSFKRSGIKPAKVFHPTDALLIFAIIFIIIFYCGTYLFTIFKHREYLAILITQWGLFFPIAIFVIWYYKIDLKNTLNLKRFNALTLLGSILMILGGEFLIIQITQLQFEIFPEWLIMAEKFGKMLSFNMTTLNPLVAFFVFAVTPGICEELVFRGILLSSFKKYFSPTFAIIAVSLIFGLFHIYVFRLLPTAMVGLYLTYIVYKSGSIYLGMIGHALHNGIALLIVRKPEYVKNIEVSGTASMPIAVIVVMTALLVLGFLLIHYSNRKELATEQNNHTSNHSATEAT